MQTISNIIPFCIYHYSNVSANEIFGYVGLSSQEIKDDKIKIECSMHKNINGIGKNLWFYNTTFYAIEPSFRPIPAGMKIFCVERNASFPYDSKKLKIVYDPFTIDSNCTYFITYNKPVPNTVPLYFHRYGDHVFPSLIKTPPKPDWTQEELSPVFVMAPETVGDIYSKNNQLKFNCINGRCIPWVKNIPNVYGNRNKLFSFEQCVLYCNELVVSDNHSGAPLQLIDRIYNETPENQSVLSFKGKISLTIIGIVLILAFILIVVLYLTGKNKF